MRLLRSEHSKTNRSAGLGARAILKIGARSLLGACLLKISAPGCALAASLDAARLPPPADRQVDFARDIRPILESSCLRCHGPVKPKSSFRLYSRKDALQGGDENSDDIVPGDSAHSQLIRYVSGLVPDMQMPPPDRGAPLTGTQIGLLRAWIDQGARWSASPEELEFSLTPLLRWTAVSGDRNKFRELEGIEPGWGGGAKHFAWRKPLGPDADFSGEGRAIYPDDDFQLKLSLRKTDLGFVRAGVETWRKFYDDTGGYAPLLPTNSFRLNRDLSLLIGRVWANFGLSLPDKPQIVLGYEYRFRQGNEATLQWGPVGTQPLFPPPTDAKNIYPAFKHINEGVHILKLDISHEISGWALADRARVEFYNLGTARQDLLGFPASDDYSRVVEHDSHTQGANTFSVNKKLADWLSVSGAYYYSQLDGDASLRQNTYGGSGNLTGGDQWYGNAALFRESHSASLAGLAGPWSGLALSLGVQGDWTRQRAMGFSNLQEGDPNAPPLFDDASRNTGNLDSASARENIAVRYLQIPWTVLYAEGRFRQEDFSRFEDRPDAAAFSPFTYNADENIASERYRAGFDTSPWTPFLFGADFQHRDERTDYTHLSLFNPAGYAYPGFFNWRDIADDQVRTRLVYRPAPWLRTAFDFRWQKSDFESSTRAVDFVTPGGDLEAGRYDAQVYSFNAVLTPWRRLFFSGTFSYIDSSTTTVRNHVNYLAPYRGQTYSVLGSATFALNADTELQAFYSFSQSNYGQHDLGGLPLGIDYDRHALQAGLTHRFSKRLSGNLTYAFARYREPSAGGALDYTAHSILATVTISWP